MPVSAAKQCRAVKSVNTTDKICRRAASPVQSNKPRSRNAIGLYMFPHERLISIAANP